MLVRRRGSGRCSRRRDAVDRFTLLVEREVAVDRVAIALHVAVQVRHVVGDELAVLVVPGTRADAIARVHGRLAVGRRRAQIGAPRAAGRRRDSARLGHLRAVGVGARKAAVVGAVALAHARDEERRRTRRPPAGPRPGLSRQRLSRRRWRLGERDQGRERGEADRREDVLHLRALNSLLGCPPTPPSRFRPARFQYVCSMSRGKVTQGYGGSCRSVYGRTRAHSPLPHFSSRRPSCPRAARRRPPRRRVPARPATSSIGSSRYVADSTTARAQSLMVEETVTLQHLSARTSRPTALPAACSTTCAFEWTPDRRTEKPRVDVVRQLLRATTGQRGRAPSPSASTPMPVRPSRWSSCCRRSTAISSSSTRDRAVRSARGRAARLQAAFLRTPIGERSIRRAPTTRTCVLARSCRGASRGRVWVDPDTDAMLRIDEIARRPDGRAGAAQGRIRRAAASSR